MAACRPRWQGLAACAAAAWVQGCASPPVTVTESALWPFRELRIRTSEAGPIDAYLSRALGESRRFAIVVQSRLCDQQESSASGAAPVSTAGVLWEQFKFDAAFLQFERPGGSLRAAEGRTQCTPDFRNTLTIDRWSRAASEVVAAIRAHEDLSGLPSVYVGAGEGALTAARLAAADRRASALILMSASGFNQRLEWLVAALHADVASLPANNDRANAIASGSVDPAAIQAERSAVYWRSVLENSMSSILALRPHLPVMIVHGIDDEYAPIEAALALFSGLDRQDRPLAMLVVQHAGRDLGLGGAHPECYEAVVRKIAAQLDRWPRRHATLPGELAVIDCGRVRGEEKHQGFLDQS